LEKLAINVADVPDGLQWTNDILIYGVWGASQVRMVMSQKTTKRACKVTKQEHCKAGAGGCVLWSFPESRNNFRESWNFNW